MERLIAAKADVNHQRKVDLYTISPWQASNFEVPASCYIWLEQCQLGLISAQNSVADLERQFQLGWMPTVCISLCMSMQEKFMLRDHF